jgi:hypothetical protein
MILTLVVPDPPPTRAHPGRAAERNSPAAPLVRAGEAVIRANPGVFPRVFSTIEVVFGKTMPDVDPLGYQPDHPIYEVQQDIGFILPKSRVSRGNVPTDRARSLMKGCGRPPEVESVRSLKDPGHGSVPQNSDTDGRTWILTGRRRDSSANLATRYSRPFSCSTETSSTLLA